MWTREETAVCVCVCVCVSNAHGIETIKKNTNTLTHLDSHMRDLMCSLLSIVSWVFSAVGSECLWVIELAQTSGDNIRSAMSSTSLFLPPQADAALNLPYRYPTWPHGCRKPKWTTVLNVDGNNHCRIAFNQRLKWGWLEASPHAD